jgi:hypothetical protein
MNQEKKKNIENLALCERALTRPGLVCVCVCVLRQGLVWSVVSEFWHGVPYVCIQGETEREREREQGVPHLFIYTCACVRA